MMKLIREEWNIDSYPAPVPDLTYSELLGMIDHIMDPDQDESVQAYYMNLIDNSLPGAKVSDLIFWPDEWFKDESMLNIELTSELVAGYIMAWTKRRVKGAEEIELPELPESKLNDTPPVTYL